MGIVCISRYSNKYGCAIFWFASRKLAKPTPTSRNRCCSPRITRSRKLKAIVISSSHEDGGQEGVWLRVRILKSLVLSLSTMVRATRFSLREADQAFLQDGGSWVPSRSRRHPVQRYPRQR